MLLQQLESDMKDAMRSKDRVRLQTIRLVRAAIKQIEIDSRTAGVSEVTDEDAVSVLQKQAKQRRDSITQFRNAGRDDLADTELAELAIIESYLPEQLSEDKIRSTVKAVIAGTGANSMKDIGKVMGPAMNELKGRADGGIVQRIVRELLST
ncbi:MAG: GatB/YqeY domain-containing protein [Bacteroidetes bacterium]|nr:MAG: GatB/YqeY domain-containing protein [Bacteroidota bacterium]